MDSEFMDAAVGFAQEIPGGWVFEIGNSWLTRRIHCVGGRIGTTSFIHNLNAEEYLEETIEEFAIEVSKAGVRRKLDFREFVYVRHETPEWDDAVRVLDIHLETNLDGVKIPVVVSYTAHAEDNFLNKSVSLPPSDSDWVLESVTVENLRLKEMVEGISPLSRYPTRFGNGEDDVHTDPDKVSTESPKSRLAFGSTSRSVLTYWGFNEGLFFFMDGPLGTESFDRSSGILMRQRVMGSLRDEQETAYAIIGAYAGPPELGFKRYTEMLASKSVMSDKPAPVEWNTWFITRGDTPVLTDCDRNLLMSQIPHICETGFYDVLHIDLGWEAGKPMLPDPVKFPNGLAEIVRKASECGLDMGYWVNPFSCNYWKSDIESEHPEWLNPAKASGQSGAHAICPMTDYFDYVEKRLTELVTTYNARLIYWDGGDWTIPYCTSTEHDHKSQDELEVRAIDRLNELTWKLRIARPDLIIAIFSPPFDNHLLGVIDQQQVSDTYAFPLGQAELIQRQQTYQMTWEHPYMAIRGSWHGVNWHQSGSDTLKRPLKELIFAEMSMLGNGVNQAGGSVDLEGAPPEFIEFLKRMFGWRKRFEPYFRVYQHILGFPDGVNVDGEGHIINGKGFLLLVNPSEEPQSVILPLDEPELEIPSDKTYSVYDWSDFETGHFLGRAKPGADFLIEIAGNEVKVIGVDIRD